MCARYYAVFIFKYRFVYFFNKIEFYLKLKLFDVTFRRERDEKLAFPAELALAG